ncbi:MAG: MFS transporter [Bryobacteraceae bacterium]
MTNTRAGFILVAYLWFALGINYVDRQMVYSIFPALKSDLHFTDSQLGLIGGVFSWIYSFCMPIAGRFADLWRRDRMIVASMALWSVATLGCGLAGSIAVFLMWRSVVAVTEALYYPAAVGLLAAAHGDATRSKALGIHQSAQLAGIVAGGWYGGWMADNYSWRIGFGIATAAGVAYSLLLLRQLPPSPPPAEPAPFSFRQAAALFSSRCYAALCAAFFAFCAMLWTFYAWFPAFLYERYGLSMTSSGFNATIFVQASCGLGVVAGAALADRLIKLTPAARFYVAAAGVLLSAPFGYLTFAATSLDMARIWAAAYGACSGFMVANVFAASYDVIDRANFGMGAGVLNMVGGISAAIMIYLAGALKGTVGFAGLLQWVALACVVSAIVLALTARSRLAIERT